MSADLGALFICGLLAYLLWARPVHGQDASMYLSLAPLLGLFVTGYALLGLYPGMGLGGVEMLRRLTIVTTFSFAFVAATVFALKVPHLYSRMTFGITFLSAIVCVPAVRYGVLRLVRRWDWWAKPVVLVADPEEAGSAVTALLRATDTGYRPVGVLHPRDSGGSSEIVGLPNLGTLDQASLATSRGIWTAVVAAEATPRTELIDELRQHFRHVLMIRSYADVGVERLQVRNLGGTLCIEYANNLLLPHNRAAKRSLDVAVAGMMLFLLLPIILLALLATLMASRGPLLYLQTRRGRLGRRFKMPKIRTMCRDADDRLPGLLEQNPEAAANWGRSFKLESDPRIVPIVGTFLRRFSIDETPQLVSVILGDMSLVGPRPLPDYHLQSLPEAVQRVRQEVRPGITGLWQISGRSDTTLEDQGARDMYYIRNWTVWMDLYVLGRTVGTVLSGRGAY